MLDPHLAADGHMSGNLPGEGGGAVSGRQSHGWPRQRAPLSGEYQAGKADTCCHSREFIRRGYGELHASGPRPAPAMDAVFGSTLDDFRGAVALHAGAAIEQGGCAVSEDMHGGAGP